MKNTEGSLSVLVRICKPMVRRYDLWRPEPYAVFDVEFNVGHHFCLVRIFLSFRQLCSSFFERGCLIPLQAFGGFRCGHCK